MCTRSTDAINFVEFDIGKRVNRPPLVSAPSARKRKRSDMSQEDRSAPTCTYETTVWHCYPNTCFFACNISVRCNEVYFKIILRFLDNMQVLR